MTELEQQIAIAEACGRKHKTKACRGIQASLTYWTGPDGRDYGIHPLLPDYLHDLNAMHEAEKALDGPQLALMKSELVAIIVRDGLDAWVCFHATAAQRAEAFLRTIGKWKDV